MTYSEIVESAALMPPAVSEAVGRCAQTLRDKAVLPIVGAGASHSLTKIACELAEDLWTAVDRGALGMIPRPSRFNELRNDLGKVCDLIYLAKRSNADALESLGFADETLWPDGDAIASTNGRNAQEWVFRLMARMARDRFCSEAVTFNYDCHYEGGLRREGFRERERPILGTPPWPERMTVVADAQTHAELGTRGDFVLNKVHGCVRRWRRCVAGPAAWDVVRDASEAIVLRWSQLLDWRGDEWSRDLFRDRARRHVLLLIGFGGVDPVIHSSLQSVLREVGAIGADGPVDETRVFVIDKDPNTLTLQMLIDAGGGDASCVVEVGHGSSGLPAILLKLHAELVELRLRSQVPTLSVPRDERARLRRFAISGPAMTRLSAEILARTSRLPGVSPTAVARGTIPEMYVPLTWDPVMTAQAFETRDAIAARLGVPSEPAGSGGAALALKPRTSDVRRFIPVGVRPDVVGEALRSTPRDTLRPLLDIGPDDAPLIVCLDRSELVYWSAETGESVAF